MSEAMSDPSRAKKSDDSMLSIAADFARVLWSPTAVFRRRRATRTRRALFVLWLIMTVLALPLLFTLFIAHPEADDARVVLVLALISAPIAAVALALLIATLEGGAVWLGATALGDRLPLHRAVLIAALSSSVATLLTIPQVVAFFATGQFRAFVENPQTPDFPGWIDAFQLSLSPLAPESRPFLAALLSSIGLPTIWAALVHAIGARETVGIPRPLRFSAPVFWAASVAVMLALVAIFELVDRSAEYSDGAIEKVPAESADTTRAPAGAP
jgi:hypothetical protein